MIAIHHLKEAQNNCQEGLKHQVTENGLQRMLSVYKSNNSLTFSTYALPDIIWD
jgi:hypothetical protein